MMSHRYEYDEQQQQLPPLTMAGLACRRRWSALSVRAELYPNEIDQVYSESTRATSRQQQLQQHDDDDDEILNYQQIHQQPQPQSYDTSTDGWTVLHWICCNGPPQEFLSNLLLRHESARRAARMQDAHGMTPLLCACACQASLETISILLHAVPDCIHIYDADGWTALHYVCSQVMNETSRGTGGGRDYDDHLDYHGRDFSSLVSSSRRKWTYPMAVVQLLLSFDPSLPIVQDCYQRNPIKLLCGLFEMELSSFNILHGGRGHPTITPLNQQLSSSLLVLRDNQNHPLNLTTTSDLVQGLWPLMQLMMNSAFASSQDEILSNSTILHRVVALPDVVTMELLNFALAMLSPDVALEQDAHGNTPLHLMAIIIQQQVSSASQETANPTNYGPLFHSLLQFQQDAAEIRNAQGMVPLQYMLNQPWNYIHAALVHAFPAGVETCGLSDEHYAFILAQVSGGATSPTTTTSGSNWSSISSSGRDHHHHAAAQTIYEILRARPNLVMMNNRRAD